MQKVAGQFELLKAIREHGLRGSFIPSSVFGKHVRIAQKIIKEEPGGWRFTVEVAKYGTDVWPFEPPWDVFDFYRHYHKARARYNEVLEELKSESLSDALTFLEKEAAARDNQSRNDEGDPV